MFRGVFLFLFLLPLARAADYYVSSAGDDNETGASPDHALLSIQKLNEIDFVPGDRVFFQGGETFKGSLYLDERIAGDAAHPIVISSYGQTPATLIANTGEDSILIHDAIGIDISNLIIHGEREDGSQNIGSGIHLCSYDKTLATGFVHLKNIEITGFAGADSNDSGFGDGVLIDNKAAGGIVSDVVMENMKIHDNEQTGVRTFSRNGSRQKNIQILNSEIFHHPGNAQARINSGSGVNLGFASNVTVEGNKVYENGSLNRANGGPVGIWTWLSDHITFRNNQSFHNRTNSRTDGGGFDFDGGVTDSLMEGNLSWENDGAGFMLCGLIALGPIERVTVRNNRSVNDGRRNFYAGLHVYDHVSDAVFENNQVMMYASAFASNPVVLVHSWVGTNVGFTGNIYEAGPGIPALTVTNGTQIPDGLTAAPDGTYVGLKASPLRW